MAFPALNQGPESRLDPGRPAATLDKDIVSFCARQPHLIELAFTLADHGHTHVGHVARLTLFTVSDLAGGDRALAEELRHRLRHAGLDFGLSLASWFPPLGDEISTSLD
jgi:hypothetical protein